MIMVMNFNPMENQSNKIEALDSIRGIAALLVVLFHVPLWHPALTSPLIRNGYLMVELFFVLSGFVIYSAYANRIASIKDLMRFQFLRLGRLYPVHFLFLLVYLLIELAKYLAQQKMGIASATTQPFKENNLSAFFYQLFLVQAIGPTGYAGTFNGPAWSISVEFYTYLLFGLITLYCTRFKHVAFVLISLVAIYLLSMNEAHGYEYLLRCWAGFFLGCMLALFRQTKVLVLPSWVGLLAFLALLVYLAYKPFRVYDTWVFLFASLLIVATVFNQKGWFKRVLNVRPLTWLGDISYSLYMSHYAILWVANQVLRMVFHKTDIVIAGISVPQLTLPEAVVCYVLVLGLILLVSAGVYQWVEKPLRAQSRRWADAHLK